MVSRQVLKLHLWTHNFALHAGRSSVVVQMLDDGLKHFLGLCAVCASSGVVPAHHLQLLVIAREVHLPCFLRSVLGQTTWNGSVQRTTDKQCWGGDFPNL